MLQKITFGKGSFMPPMIELNIATSPMHNKGYMGSASFLDILRDGIVWNTPKKRKTIEVRNRQKFGVLKWGTGRMLRPNHRIRVDHKTGEYFELGKLAPKTYAKVLEETSQIRSKVADTFGRFTPRDKEAVVIYEGESTKERDANTLAVQMEKERPTFFSRNLTQKTNVSSTLTSSTTVRPSGLG